MSQVLCSPKGHRPLLLPNTGYDAKQSRLIELTLDVNSLKE